MIEQLCQQFNIEHQNSVPYQPQMNRVVEAINKIIKKILVRMTDTYKDWHKFRPIALWNYCTYVRTSTSATPYSLVFGMEVVLPAKVEIPYLKILSQTEMSEVEWTRS